MITLSSHGYTAKINPLRGANCVSLRHEAYNARILREPKSEVLDNPFLYGMPVLFPANRISGGKFEFEGRIYKFPINEPETGCCLHGSLHETRFSPLEIKDDFIKCEYSSKHLAFPHEFSIEISYSLSEKGLEQRTKITNTSNENMPIFLGFHTTFNIPFIYGASSENIRIFCECGNELERNANYLPTGRILPRGDFERKINSAELMPFESKFSKHCTAIKNGKIEIRDLKNGIRLVYETDKKFTYRLFYNGNADKYICLEPMNCAVDAVNTPYKRNELPQPWHALPPSASEEYISRIYLIKE